MANPESQNASMEARAGLCATCTHCERIPHPRGGLDYIRCRMADVDARFAKYPPLPVRSCTGYAPRESAPDATADE